MGKKFQRVSRSITNNVDLASVLVKSSIVAVICTVITIPYFYHLLLISKRANDPILIHSNFQTVLTLELFMFFIICFLSSIVGFIFARKYKLPGIGDLQQFVKTLPFILLVGTVMGAVTYFIFDRSFYYISPESYPKDIWYIISSPFKLAVANEVILRFCMVTIMVGLFKNKLISITIVSLFVSILTAKYFRFLGLDYPFNYYFIVQFIISFISNFILGSVYITYGLISSMALHFVFGLRLLLVVWTLG